MEERNERSEKGKKTEMERTERKEDIYIYIERERGREDKGVECCTI